MQVLVLVQVLLLASSLSSQIEAHAGEQQTITEFADNTSNQSSDLRYAMVDYVASSVGKVTNENSDTTKEEEVAKKLAERKLLEKMESPEIRTELSIINVTLEALHNSSGGTSHMDNFSKTALPATTAATVKSFPDAGAVKTGQQRSQRDIRSDAATMPDGQSDNTIRTDSGHASPSVCCQGTDEDRAATLPVTLATSNEHGGDRKQHDVENFSEFPDAALAAASKVASTMPSVAWQSTTGFSGSVAKSASGYFGASATNALPEVVTDSPWNQSRSTVRLNDATTSSMNLEEASVRTRDITGYTIKARNSSNQSAAHEAGMTTAASTTADVTSHVTDSLANGDLKIADNQHLVIIIAVSAGGIAAAALFFAVVWLLCQYHRRRLERKKLQFAQQEPRLSVLWPQALHRESVLVPRDAYICIPSEQPIELVENHLPTEITRSPLLTSFNDIAS